VATEEATLSTVHSPVKELIHALHVVALLVYFAANIFCLVYLNASASRVASRANLLFCAGGVFIYLGGRAGVMLDELRVGLSVLSLFHRWAERVCVLHVIVRAAVLVAGDE
jgi:hypothetical protein